MDRFGDDRVFLDCRSIPAGADFAEELLGRLHECSVLLVVIGPRWLTLINELGQRRLEDPRDWIRREIAEAFARGLRVIPKQQHVRQATSRDTSDCQVYAARSALLDELSRRARPLALVATIAELAGW